MKVKIDIDDTYNETFITIHAKEWSPEVEQLVKMLNTPQPKRLIGMKEEQSVLLDPNHVDYVYAEKRKVYVVSKQEKMELNMKLYEVEALLAAHSFKRFSKSVIGNLNQIERFELSFSGNLCVYFKSGNKEYVSRKYVNELKESLIMGVNKYDS